MEEDDGDGGIDPSVCELDFSDEETMRKDVECSELDKNKQKPEKRVRENEDDTEINFVTVTRKKYKKNSRSETGETELENCNDGIYEVSLFCVEELPKQMALAKFLRDEDIKNVIKIKYKSPYKVFIKLDDQTQAEKLIASKKLKEKDIRVQFTMQNTVSYGIVKDVDLEMSLKELLDNLTCPYEVISAKRLNRLDDKGKWSESKTVRLCFNSNKAPSFVCVYGCRFDVLRNEFPVTQCSRCWKFGHIRKYCKLNKNICPKCGENHDNCETKDFKCLNCKGSHMALNKICPIFKKEKEIRSIMSINNTTYKKSLEIYLKNQKELEKKRKSESLQVENNITVHSEPIYHDVIPRNLYSNIVKTTAIVHSTNECNKEEIIEKETNNINKNDKNDNNKKKKQKKNRSNKKKRSEGQNNGIDSMEVSLESDLSEEEREKITECNNRKNERKIDWWQIALKIRKIIMSTDGVCEKIVLVLKLILCEFKDTVANLLNGGIFVDNFLNFFNG